MDTTNAQPKEEPVVPGLPSDTTVPDATAKKPKDKVRDIAQGNNEDVPDMPVGTEDLTGETHMTGSGVGNRLQAWIANHKTPTGIGVAFLVLLFLIFAIVKVSGGFTRLQLAWYTFLGKTELNTSPSPGAQTPPPSTVPPNTTQSPPTGSGNGVSLPNIDLSGINFSDLGL